MEIEQYKNSVLKEVGEKRFPHIMGTVDMAKKLAGIFELDETTERKLTAAALFHDITKHFSVDEHLEYARKHGIEIPPEYQRSVKTLHELTGAYRAAELYPDVCDQTVFSAIRWHTTGHKDMTLTEKLLYLADYIEQTRTFSDCVTLREYFEAETAKAKTPDDRNNVLDDTMILSFDMTIKDLMDSGYEIHPDTFAARNDLIHKRNERKS